ncbi:unnamed protein product [Acanthosepion pharaonis]|uniref:Uncharacterized protein n=1 Tax=Acanthosepion pharaonis TaxID=158019 RepID=A0A812E8H2_ACAPH|nr:unnamed protein product [Sepia pharaonis]
MFPTSILGRPCTLNHPHIHPRASRYFYPHIHPRAIRDQARRCPGQPSLAIHCLCPSTYPSSTPASPIHTSILGLSMFHPHIHPRAIRASVYPHIHPRASYLVLSIHISILGPSKPSVYPHIHPRAINVIWLSNLCLSSGISKPSPIRPLSIHISIPRAIRDCLSTIHPGLSVPLSIHISIPRLSVPLSIHISILGPSVPLFFPNPSRAIQLSTHPS